MLSIFSVALHMIIFRRPRTPGRIQWAADASPSKGRVMPFAPAEAVRVIKGANAPAPAPTGGSNGLSGTQDPGSNTKNTGQTAFAAPCPVFYAKVVLAEVTLFPALRD